MGGCQGWVTFTRAQSYARMHAHARTGQFVTEYFKHGTIRYGVQYSKMYGGSSWVGEGSKGGRQGLVRV